MSDNRCELLKELQDMADVSPHYSGRVKRFNDDEVEFILSDKMDNHAAYRINEKIAQDMAGPKAAAEFIFLVLGSKTAKLHDLKQVT